MLCSVEVARRGVVSPRLLSMLVGSWIHVLIPTRRPVYPGRRLQGLLGFTSGWSDQAVAHSSE